jgi:hypothetical protein
MKALKILGWLLLATFLLVVLLYLTLVAINWKDEPPSAAASRFERIVADRPAVPPDDNAVVYLLGFNAPTDGDPVDLGTRRLQWLESADGVRGGEDPQRQALGFQGDGSPLALHLRDACAQDAERAQCASVFEAIVRGWQPNDLDALALRRYEALLSRRAWRDVVPVEVSTPLPGYGDVMHAQRLYLLRLAQWAAQGRLGEVRAGLTADFAFWRTAVPSADHLIAQMIAVAGLRQHFLFSNLLLRGLSAEQVTRSVPADWSREFSASERSLLRVMAGESAFFKATMADVAAGEEQASRLGRWVDRLSDPMFKLQATVNARDDMYFELCEAFSVPMERYLDAQEAWGHRSSKPASSFYNPVGAVVLSADDGTSYVQYALRVASVEGLRRAALLAMQLHTQGVAADSVGGLIANSDLRDPYTARPFEWNVERRSVSFTAPENHRWRRSEFFY